MNAALSLHPVTGLLMVNDLETLPGVRAELPAPVASVMTDFLVRGTLTVPPFRPIDEALSDMKHAGVRVLFVTDAQGLVVGFITSYDIQGERPIRFLQSTDCLQERCARGDILVADIMTPVRDLKVLHINEALNATAGELADTFKSTALTHLVVVEEIHDGGGMRVRGLFSRTRLEQMTGLKIEALCTAQSFGDVEQVFTHHDCSC